MTHTYIGIIDDIYNCSDSKIINERALDLLIIIMQILKIEASNEKIRKKFF